jgi:glycosyltransferase involved in cell wall biosynthesis
MLEFGQAIFDYLSKSGQDVQSLEPAPRFGKGKNTMAGKAKMLGYLDKFVLFPRDLKRAAKEADIVHLCGQQHALYIKYLGSTPSLLTCHDLLAVKAGAGGEIGKSGQKLQGMIRAAMPTATHIACVSTATLNDLGEYVHLKPGQASVVLNGAYEQLHRMASGRADEELRKLNLDPAAKFLFHIGGNMFYKNRPGVVRIYKELKKLPGTEDLKLIMAGQPPNAEFANELEGTDVELRENVSYNAKVALYSKAYALLFPSTAEGFGLPIVEAQMCGCPVITSNIPPMDEVALNSALLIDPRDEQGAARKIHAALSELPSFVSFGTENVKRFALDRMGADYVKLYGEVRTPSPLRGRGGRG